MLLQAATSWSAPAVVVCSRVPCSAALVAGLHMTTRRLPHHGLASSVVVLRARRTASRALRLADNHPRVGHSPTGSDEACGGETGQKPMALYSCAARALTGCNAFDCRLLITCSRSVLPRKPKILPSAVERPGIRGMGVCMCKHKLFVHVLRSAPSQIVTKMSRWLCETSRMPSMAFSCCWRVPHQRIWKIRQRRAGRFRWVQGGCTSEGNPESFRPWVLQWHLPSTGRLVEALL